MQSPGGIPSLADVPQSVITAATLMPSSSRPLTEEPRAICLRHDRNQIKKRCTCGKARRYRPGRGYAPAADDARLAAIAEAVNPLCAALRTHTQNARVAEWCCRGLQHALVDAPSRAMVTRQQNGAQLLLLVLRTHATSAKVVREALHALANLSGDEDGDAHAQTALQIARNGGLEVTAQAMAAHQDDARIQALACAVLGHTCRTRPTGARAGRRSRRCGRSRRPTRSSTCRSTTSAAAPACHAPRPSARRPRARRPPPSSARRRSSTTRCGGHVPVFAVGAHAKAALAAWAPRPRRRAAGGPQHRAARRRAVRTAGVDPRRLPVAMYTSKTI